jgi:hypothetical protein
MEGRVQAEIQVVIQAWSIIGAWHRGVNAIAIQIKLS